MTYSSPPTRDTSRARPQPCAPPRGRQVQEKSSTHAEEVSTKATVHPEHGPHVPLRLRVRRNPTPPVDRCSPSVVGRQRQGQRVKLVEVLTQERGRADEILQGVARIHAQPSRGPRHE